MNLKNEANGFPSKVTHRMVTKVMMIDKQLDKRYYVIAIPTCNLRPNNFN